MLGFLPLSSRTISGFLVFNPAPTPTPDNHDGAYDYLRKREQRQARLRREQEEKTRASNTIRQQIEDVLRPKVAETVETPPEVIASPSIAPQNAVISRDLLPELMMLEKQMMAMQILQAQEYRRWRDEEDMKVLLRLL